MKDRVKKITINFKLSNVLFDEMVRVIAKDNYGMRGKSKWITEAIERLLQLENYIEFVQKETAIIPKLKKAQAITVLPEIDKKLSKAVVEIRNKWPAMEGVRSRVIRTAIMQRLLRQ